MSNTSINVASDLQGGASNIAPVAALVARDIRGNPIRWCGACNFWHHLQDLA
jgi:hypothetical protein